MGLLNFVGVLTLVGLVSAQFTDISPEATVFESDILPQHDNGTLLPRYFASVGNGHVSTTMLTDTVYMNGLYNGERGESHRARIPSRNNIRAYPPTDEAEITDHVYGVNVGQGFAYEKYNVKGYSVEHRTFAHRYFNRVIMSQFLLTATPSADPAGVSIAFESNSGDPSADITFQPEVPFTSNVTQGATSQCGETNIPEDTRYTQARTVCVVANAIPSTVNLTPGSNMTIYFLASYDFTLADAGGDFESALTYLVDEAGGDLFILHQAAWVSLWNEGRIEVDGNLELSKIIYGSLYYILSSVPVTASTNIPVRQFYGLSPGGLAYGDYLMDYQGHSFWDTETWMYPSILYLYPRAAEQILSYRLSVIDAARDRANDSGYLGARYPWEGAVTGREVTPDCCPDTREMQIHITSDISYAVRQYIAITRDTAWLKNTKPGYAANGCTMIRDMAEFYTSRAEFNTTTRLHDIRGVMPPDEDNRPVDNNPYTNIGAGYSIFFAKYAECLCTGDMAAVPQQWLDLASSLALEYDAEIDYHPEFEGYVIGTPIKQADVVLTGFPQQYNMSASTRRNDLLIYENVTREDGPAMTWAMHTIGFLDLNDVDKAAELFEKSFRPYVREPFKVWTEAQPPTLGAINFITGMGGFLQSIVSGYGGYRLFPEKIVFQNPRVPPNSDQLRIKGLDYLNNVFDLTVMNTTFSLTLVRGNLNYPLVVEHDDVEYPFQENGISLGFVTNTFKAVSMSTLRSTNCDLPLDKIGTPRP